MRVDQLDKSSCCGCWGCENICPHHSITMTQDSEGFKYPLIDNSSCVNCGLCARICPSQTEKSYDFNDVHSYAAINRKEDVRFNSSSGGVFYELSAKMLRDGGCVYGAAFTQDWRVNHIKITDLKELRKLQKSKYLQSDLQDIYNSIKRDLKDRKKVLFSGTPCQVMGLKNFGWSDSENLICIDIACHAVPSDKSWDRYLNSIGLCRNDIESLDFRDKSYPWHNYTLTIKTKTGRSISESCDRNPFMLGFIYNLTNRPSCHNCPAKGMKSGSDIMLADFWRIEHLIPEMDDNKGTSLMVVKTEKGKSLIDDILSNFIIRPVSNNAFINRPETFMESSPAHYKRKYFFENLDKKKYECLIKDCLKHNASFLNRVLRRLGIQINEK